MTAAQLERYYKVLGISPEASLKEIKRAFRSKAKILHPDHNDSPTAHEDFLQLNKAFEIILEFRNVIQNSAQNENHTDSNWEAHLEEKIRQRLKEKAKNSYRPYTETKDFMLDLSIESIFTHLIFLLSVFNVIILPILLIYKYGSTGLIMSVVANLLMLLFTMSASRNLHKLDFRDFGRSLLYLLRSKLGISILSLSFSVMVFISIGLHTLITLPSLLYVYLGTSMLTATIQFGTSYWKHIKTNYFDVYLLSICIVPAAISLLLLLNFLFSDTPRNETYSYVAEKHVSDEGKGKTLRNSGIIRLKNDAYKEYIGIRSFSGNPNLRNEGTITYTIEEGLIGIRVVKQVLLY